MTDKLPAVRKGQGDVALSREEFERRFRERFYDPAFDAVADEIRRVVDVAWTAYDGYHKSPRTRKAGAGFADPEFALPIEWLDTRERIHAAQRAHDVRTGGRARCWCAAQPAPIRPVLVKCRRRSA